MTRPTFRFAPSPNGELHLGHAYSALLNRQLAQASAGRLLLRIEDIDTTRCTPEFEAGIFRDLEWLGLDWERPVRRQSEHFAEYQAALKRLVREELVYPAFMSRGEIRALIADFQKTSPVSDAEVQARYDQLKKQFGDKEYHARHILVPSEDTAKEIIAKLKGGAKFEDLAKQYSKDPGSAKNGGDLDWSPANAYVPEFADALQKLQKGQYTQAPVKTQFGYHVIELDDVRDAQIPPLSDVKPQLVQQMQEEKLQGFIEGLEKKAKIQ